MIMAMGAAFAMMLAGCSGGNNDTGTSGGDGSGCAGTECTSGGPTDPGPGGGSAASAGPHWSQQNVTHQFTATAAGSSGALGSLVTFTLPENTTAVWFNVTITASVPGGTPATEFVCDFQDSDHFTPTAETQATFTTSNDAGQVKVSKPMQGDWRIAITSTGAPNQGTFVLNVNSLVP